MKKTIFTLCVDGYPKNITDITLPLMRQYADKIGADMCVIIGREFPDWPVVYEKFQIYTLAREMGTDWCIYFDADAIVHPDMPDITAHLSMDTVMQNAKDLSSSRWTYDEYMRRDGRFISSCNWFCAFSRLCLDIYHPLEDLTQAQAVANIFPCQQEINWGIEPSHLIDDYVVTRNIARYGLKHTTFIDVREKLGISFGHLWHSYMQTNEQKLEAMEKVLVNWKLREKQTA